MNDSYWRRCREVAQLETVNAELQKKTIIMAKYIYSHKREYLGAAMVAAYSTLGIEKPKQLKLKVA